MPLLDYLTVLVVFFNIVGSLLVLFEDKKDSNKNILIGGVCLLSSVCLTTLKAFYNKTEEEEYFQKQPTVLPPVTRPLPEKCKEDTCPITYEPFCSGDTYIECAQCQYCFHSDAAEQALKITSRTCPMCRAPWKMPLAVFQVPVSISVPQN